MDSAGVAELYSWRKGAIDLAVCASLWFISNADEAKRRCIWNNATYIDRRRIGEFLTSIRSTQTLSRTRREIHPSSPSPTQRKIYTVESC